MADQMMMAGTELAEKQAIDTREQILVGVTVDSRGPMKVGSHFLLWRNEWGVEDKIHYS